jgi:aminoglycoside/choline kinase family phosphotransferase
MSPHHTASPSDLDPGTDLCWSDPQRQSHFAQWLSGLAPALGLNPATVRLASADASFRRYFRVDTTQGSRIIMDAPPDKEDCRAFVKVAQLMAQAHLHAPRRCWHGTKPKASCCSPTWGLRR